MVKYMLSESKQVRDFTQNFLKPFCEILARLKFSPNIISFLGVIFSFFVVVFLYFDNIYLALLFLILASLCDIIDGSLARIYNLKSSFGAFLDSFLDRYSDFFIFFGILIIAFKKQDILLFIFGALALAGAFLTSYAKARAESLGIKMKVGFFERPERIIFLIVSFLVLSYSYFLFKILIIILAIFTNLTAIQRFLFVKKVLQKKLKV
ncbi:MAG TPA: CDP-alcohol phosphatidyltransferase family protein [Desulfurobacteriaceae bacterium]|nr:CDP-alcohol phosphatidyltransferase family protein [Desulfurobacteriaceae bacterium]